MNRLFLNFLLAAEGVTANTLRAVLTALGIVFGVGAVIAMLAIGTGARQSILDQMELIGTNNIIIRSKVLKAGESADDKTGSEGDGQDRGKQKRPWSPGLTLQDVQAFRDILPNIELLSPEVVMEMNVLQEGLSSRARVVGVWNSYFDINNLEVVSGQTFHQEHLDGGHAVCIIGQSVRMKYFSDMDPLGQYIKAGKVWLKVIGVLNKREASGEQLQALGVRDYNKDIYVPVSTVLLRMGNRAAIGARDLQRRGRESADEENYHQLDRVVIKVQDAGTLRPAAGLLADMLRRRHKEVMDFEIEIPELLLQQQRKTQDIFNLVLAVIAGISLLVGGIGIMNIMLASVLERIKEIGIRRSMGARRSDIIFQFLFEAVIISLIGGLLGIFFGVGTAGLISRLAGIPTIISAWSVLLSFGVAAAVGLAFGLFPARKAAREDPVRALRAD